ncbi:MAG: cobalamin biosynthesis protein CobD [Hyphomicrobiales bacterium]|nr:cobalamin biosynthesis protein CobD [Hyphomicrobiales bacterium]
MNLAPSPTLALAACLIEAAAGYPAPLYRAIQHPVTWMGAWLAVLEARLNRPSGAFARRRAAGVVALALYLAPVAALACAAVWLAPTGLLGFVPLALIAASLPAQRSLDEHVRAVALALEREGLAAGREAVSRIVGRNVAMLDEAGVARAALESLAENFSDGIVAPLFWLALGGLPGGALYKAINTADSMIGHRSDRYLAFGWAAARLDDLVNLPASRLAALWLLIAALLIPGARPAEGWRALRRDAHRHRSPNAGWPEAAMVGALGLKLAGPRVYGETRVDDAYMGEGRAAATAADIRRGLALYRLACVVEAVMLAALALIARG